MSALSPALAESELFGHKKGAFTGATENKMGKFQAAQDGVVFLDEIGDCSLEIQAKLLRTLEEKEIVRVGENHAEKVNCKIVSATNLDLDQLVLEGKFRADLLDRIRGAVVHLPPLRERKDDIPLLTAHFVRMGASRATNPTISSRAMAALLAYSWPGNVRELGTTVRGALIACHFKEIDLQHLPAAITKTVADLRSTGGSLPIVSAQTAMSSVDEEEFDLKKALAAAERVIFLKAIERAKGSRKLAIKLLNVTESTFFRRARELGVLKEEVVK